MFSFLLIRIILNVDIFQFDAQIMWQQVKTRYQQVTRYSWIYNMDTVFACYNRRMFSFSIIGPEQ